MLKILRLFTLITFSSWTLIAHTQIAPFKPACQDFKNKDNSFDFNIFKNINITYDNNKFRKDVFRKFKLAGSPVYSTTRKWHPVKLSISLDKKTCILEAKMRLTGDLNDHIEFQDPKKISASLLVQLKDESINGVKRFKLLLPQTRNGHEEIFSANILSSLGFLAPRTSMVTLKLNGQPKTMIFQEDLVKEFLEFNEKVEGPIIEGDERFGIGSKLTTSKIANYGWAAKSKTHLLITENALSTINFAYLAHSSLVSKFNPDPYFDFASVLSSQLEKNNITKIEAFDSLVFALNAQHLLTRDDSRFYFDPVMRYFDPIYYDGQPTFLTSNSLNSKTTTESAQRGVDEALKKLGELKSEQLEKRLIVAGFNFDGKNLLNLIQKLRLNLTAIRDLKPEGRSYLIDKSILIRDGKYSNVSFLMRDHAGKLFECSIQLIKCNSSNIPLSGKILAGKEPNYPDLIFLGNFLSENIDKPISAYAYPLSIVNRRTFAINEKTSLHVTDDLNVYLDKAKREIRLVAQTPDAHALIEGGDMYGWHISYIGTKAISNREGSRFFSTGLTGCLNLRDVEVSGLVLSTKNTACEDAINTVRVSGSIRLIDIENATEDGLDLDFSKLKIDKIKVKNAGNDCVDLSYGKYKFGQLELQNCADKGLSSGETAEVSISNFTANNTKSAIVVKDGSIVEIQKAKLTNYGKCVAVYRKKSEFLGATLKLKDINCEDSKFFVQENSSLVRLPL